jgi:hypothetical protein
MARKKTAKEKSRVYYLRARGTPEPIPHLTPDQELLAHEKAREVIGNWREHLEQSQIPKTDTRSKLISLETGRVVIGSAAMSEEEWRTLIAHHPSAYTIIPPQEEATDV